MNYLLIERNERRSRHMAIFGTIVLHAALFTWLYFAASEKTETRPEAQTSVPSAAKLPATRTAPAASIP